MGRGGAQGHMTASRSMTRMRTPSGCWPGGGGARREAQVTPPFQSATAAEDMAMGERSAAPWQDQKRGSRGARGGGDWKKERQRDWSNDGWDRAGGRGVSGPRVGAGEKRTCRPEDLVRHGDEAQKGVPERGERQQARADRARNLPRPARSGSCPWLSVTIRSTRSSPLGSRRRWRGGRRG